MCDWLLICDPSCWIQGKTRQTRTETLKFGLCFQKVLFIELKRNSHVEERERERERRERERERVKAREIRRNRLSERQTRAKRGRERARERDRQTD